ncbi:MAG: ankyrin repeat domain-containing protein, partial [bacterium]
MHLHYIPRLVVAFACLLLPNSDIAAEAIHSAVKNGDMAGIEVLVDNDRGVLNKQDESGKTPLHLAIERDFTDIARYLIEHGANTNLTDKDNESPLHYSASAGNLEIGRLLLEQRTTSLNDSNAVKHG